MTPDDKSQLNKNQNVLIKDPRNAGFKYKQ